MAKQVKVFTEQAWQPELESKKREHSTELFDVHMRHAYALTHHIYTHTVIVKKTNVGRNKTENN